MAIMASPALEGYHSVVTYSWDYNGYNCEGEDAPILYAAREGTYTCQVFSENHKIELKSSFCVHSKLNKLHLQCPYLIAVLQGRMVCLVCRK